MPRRLRSASGGLVYHVLNRAGDYAAFLKVLRQAGAFQPMRVLAFCVMPNHWHLLLWPQRDGDLSEYVRWLTGLRGQGGAAWLCEGAVARPADWLAYVNKPQTEAELEALRRSVARGLGLESALREVENDSRPLFFSSGSSPTARGVEWGVLHVWR